MHTAAKIQEMSDQDSMIKSKLTHDAIYHIRVRTNGSTSNYMKTIDAENLVNALKQVGLVTMGTRLVVSFTDSEGVELSVQQMGFDTILAADYYFEYYVSDDNDPIEE